MLPRRRELRVRRHRRGQLWGMGVLSLGLHLAGLLLVLIVVRLPPLPTEPPSVEVIMDAGPAQADEVPAASAPAAAVPTEAVPTEAVPAAAPPPPTPEAESPPPPAPTPPPPPPPDQTDLASLVPPPPPPTPEAPPPPEAHPPPPRRVAVKPPPRRTQEPAPTARAAAPSAVAEPAQAAEGPESAVQVVGADLGPDWIRQLQAWWDKHAFFPGEAVAKSLSGTVKVHIVVRPDGEVSSIHVVQRSGSKVFDNAAYEAFQDARLHPFPPGTPAPQADVFITLHYVLTEGQATAALLKRPFTVTNKAVQAANASSLQQKTCTGVLVLDTPTGEIDSLYGRHTWARAIFYRTPDGKPRVKFWTSFNSSDAPVSDYDGSAGWLGPVEKKGPQSWVQLRYSLWPAGPDHVGGSVVDVYSAGSEGTIDLTCDRG